MIVMLERQDDVPSTVKDVWPLGGAVGAEFLL